LVGVELAVALDAEGRRVDDTASSTLDSVGHQLQAMNAPPENGDASGLASAAEKPKRG